MNDILTFVNPLVGHAGFNEQVACLFGHMYPITDPRILNPGGGVDGVPEELEASLVASQDTGSHRTTIEAESHGDIARITRPKDSLELAHDNGKMSGTVAGKARHDDRMLFVHLRDSHHRDIRVANRLDLEYPPALVEGIE
jgi:hypothetical protein